MSDTKWPPGPVRLQLINGAFPRCGDALWPPFKGGRPLQWAHWITVITRSSYLISALLWGNAAHPPSSTLTVVALCLCMASSPRFCRSCVQLCSTAHLSPLSTANQPVKQGNCGCRRGRLDNRFIKTCALAPVSTSLPLVLIYFWFRYFLH